MEQTKKPRIAEWSMLAGLAVGLLAGVLLGERFFAEALVGGIIGAGFGLVIAAVVCGLRG
jgi:high-affinity Fe2+/Pb2+ permease